MGENMIENIEEVSVGNVVVCYDDYSCNAERHHMLVQSIETDEEEEVILFGEDLCYLNESAEFEDGDNEYIARVNVANFLYAYPREYLEDNLVAYIISSEYAKTFVGLSPATPLSPTNLDNSIRDILEEMSTEQLYLFKRAFDDNEKLKLVDSGYVLDNEIYPKDPKNIEEY
jgi:hypothetical protein